MTRHELVAAPDACGPGCMLIGVVGLCVGPARSAAWRWSAALGFVLQRSVDAEVDAHRARTWPPWSTPARCRSRCRWPAPDQVQVVDAPGPGAGRLDRRRPAGADAAPGRAGPGRGAGEQLFVDGDRLGLDRAGAGGRASPAGPAGRPADRRRRHGRWPTCSRACGLLRTMLLIVFPLLRAGAGAGGLAGDRRDAAPGRGAAPRGRGDHRRPAGRAGCRCRPATTRSTGWRSPSTTCWTGWRRAGPGSASSSPTPRTSCAARWRTCAPSSRWPSGSARRPTGRRSATTCSPTRPG